MTTQKYNETMNKLRLQELENRFGAYIFVISMFDTLKNAQKNLQESKSLLNKMHSAPKPMTFKGRKQWTK